MTDLPATDPVMPPKPPVSAGLLAAVAFLAAAGLAVLIGWGMAQFVEARTAEVVRTRLLTQGYSWAHVATDGLIVTLTGTAPTEAQRFAAVNLTGDVVDAGRISDGFDVTPAKMVAPPHFSVEILRNDDGVQLIGLVPDGPTRQTLTDAVLALKTADAPADMLDTASYPEPAGWADAVTFGMTALQLLPRAKITVAAEGVTITAIAASGKEKRQFEAALSAAAPKGLNVTTTITAPRPVLTPFTLRFVIDARGARFDACSADTEAARVTILRAATAAGAGGNLTCTIGMGVPSPSWADATSQAITALKVLGAGTVTFSDADITLQAGDTVTQAAFDRTIGELRASLPDVFSLDAQMPDKAVVSAGPAEFTANVDPKSHRAVLRGRLSDDRMQAAVTSFAKARFGAGNIYVATIQDANLPDGWTERVLAGLQALSVLDNGAVLVRPDTVEVSGVSGDADASDTISQLLSERLGQGKTFKVDVSYDKALDPMAGLPTPQECLDRLNAVQAKGKITFDPGSAEISASSAGVMDALAMALKNCSAMKLEIAGHTDAQGSASGNLNLSQARAEAVMVALQGRQVDVSVMRAVGYGEGVPIADNGTEAGREANRRIEFTLMESGAASGSGLASLITPASPSHNVDTSATPSVPLVLPAVSETSADGSALAPDKPTVRPKGRPQDAAQDGVQNGAQDGTPDASQDGSQD